MRGWSVSGSTKANRHWQSGQKSGVFDLLKADTLPYSGVASNGSSLQQETVRTVKYLNTKKYAYVWHSGSTSNSGIYPAGVKLSGASDYSSQSADEISRNVFINANRYIKTAKSISDSLEIIRKMEILSLPNEWKDKNVYFIKPFNGYTAGMNHWTICYPGTSAGGSAYLYSTTILSDVTYNTGSLAELTISDYYSDDVTGYKITKGAVYQQKDIIRSNDHWNEKIGLAMEIRNLFFLVNDSSNEAEEELTGSFKIRFSYEYTESNAENG